jgi:hypothetical protein
MMSRPPFLAITLHQQWAWKLENIVTLSKPIECRGFQKLWTPDESIITRLPLGDATA